MTNDPANQRLPDTPATDAAQPVSASCPLVSPAHPIHHENANVGCNKLGPDREPRPPARAATQPPAAPAKRCLFTKPDGTRCGKIGRWKSGLCGHHDPARAAEMAEQRRRGGEAAKRAAATRTAVAGATRKNIMDGFNRITPDPRTLATVLSAVADAMLKGEIDAKRARQVRLLASRIHRSLAFRRRRRRPAATVPPQATPEPGAPADTPATPDAP